MWGEGDESGGKKKKLEEEVGEGAAVAIQIGHYLDAEGVA
mgnify:CR=1 FL=1